ncbi:MAG: 16S rRNA (guanine(527)-N(7))-methyltransferase RsmG [Maricaulis sp.]|nr:16S rRNA (guanine(527)-N(7))-methyltransferase RsmG [Maricaulis sp.]HAQ36613.1 16S rRNA (guanine(527)-N(7))-methyltransferase RsmG [Alphaproteobacteria bacterium]
MTREDFAAQTGVSRETLERYDIWRRLIVEWSAHTNLVGRATLDDFWHRHALDSWQVTRWVTPGARWADLGSGAGFPGLAIAFAMQEAGSGEVVLVESIGKKAAFLAKVVRETAAPATVAPIRAESLDPAGGFDIVTARAMAALPKLLGYAHPLLKKGAKGLFLKGAKHQDEIRAARVDWRFDADCHDSLTGGGGVIIEVKELARG